MSQARKHFKNTTSLLAAGALSKVVMFLAIVVIVKALPVADNGVFLLAFKFGLIFSLLAELGVRGYLLREMARRVHDPESARALFGDVFNVRLALTFVVAPLVPLVMVAAGYPERLVLAAWWFFVFNVLDSYAMLFKFVLRAYERMEFDAVFSVIGRGVLLAVVGLFYWQTHTLTLGQVVIAHLSGTLVECAGLAVFLRALLPVRFINRSSFAAMREALVRSTPFAVVNVVGILYMSTGAIALSKLMGAGGDKAVAYFTTAGKLPEAALFFPMALVNAVVPFLSRNLGDTPLVRRYFDFLMRYILFGGGVLAACFLVAPEAVILLISKKEYLVATPAFRLYGVWMVASFAQYATANILICLNQERTVMRRYFVALVMNVGLNLLLVPRLGVTGAGVALAASQVTVVTLDLLFLRRMGITMAPRGVALVVGLVVVAGAVLLAWQGIVPPIVQLAAGCVAGGIYVGAVALIEDRELIRRVLRRTPSTDASAAPAETGA